MPGIANLHPQGVLKEIDLSISAKFQLIIKLSSIEIIKGTELKELKPYCLW